MIENTILSGLLTSEEFSRRVLPHLKKDYFSELGDQILFKLVKDFTLKYNKTPTKESLEIDLQATPLKEGPYESAMDSLGKLTEGDVDTDWLVDQTEQFCKRQALFNAISLGAELLSKPDTSDYGKMSGLVQDALSVTFDDSIGHDFTNDLERRFQFYHDVAETLSSDLSMLNTVCSGGFRNGTLTVFLAPTGGGKTIMMCHLAGSYLMQGKNVLYISMEMAEELIAERIDANLMDIPMEQLRQLEKNTYMKRWEKLKAKSLGKLVVKQYPTGSAHVGHFRHLLNELKLKKSFKPDVIIIDYLNICASESSGKNSNSFEKVKYISEEVRGLGVEYEARIITATQVNRDGASNVDFDLTHTSESFGIPMTADYMFGIISTEQLTQLGRIKIKQLKNRFSGIDKHPHFFLNIDKSRMKLWDCDDDTQPTHQQNKGDIVPETSAEKKRETDDFEDRFSALISG